MGGIVPETVIVGIVVLVVLAAGWLAVQSGEISDRLPVVVGGVVAAAVVLGDRPVLGLAIAGLSAAASGWLCASPTSTRFWCLLVAAAMGVVAGVELVVVADDLISGPAYRMNTVFKFYNQVWILLAIAGAVGVAAMSAVATRRSRITAPRLTGSDIGGTNATEYTMDSRNVNVDDGPRSTVKGRWAIFGLAVSTLVVAASLLYPGFAVGPRLAQRFPDRPPLGTLNALGWMQSGELFSEGAPAGSIAFAGDLATIDWFNREVGGSPVIAEASIGPYRCNGSRISIATGLPTIIGWERHESQQRPADELPERVADVDRLYRSQEPREKERILRRYNVEYVVVGDLERAYPVPDNQCTATGSAEGIAVFDEMVGESLEVAFADAGTTVYRVLPSPVP
jgi:uncharacterized membrane protein